MRPIENATFEATVPIGFGKKGDVAKIDARVTVTGQGFPHTIEVRLLGGDHYVDITTPHAFDRRALSTWGAGAAEAMAHAIYRQIVLWLGSRDGATQVRIALDSAERGPTPDEARQIVALEMQRGAA